MVVNSIILKLYADEYKACKQAAGDANAVKECKSTYDTKVKILQEG